jgi:hypothetical protein
MALRTIFLWSMVISLSVAAGLGVIAALSSWGRGTERLILTAMLVAGFSIHALACSIVMSKRRAVVLMWLSMAMGGVTSAIGLLFVWTNIPYQSTTFELLAKGSGIALTTAIWGMHFGLLQLLPVTTERTRMVRIATLIVAGLLAALIVLAILSELDEEWAGRILAVLSILTACGSAITPVLALLDFLRHRGRGESIPSRVTIELKCPRCFAEQTVRAGTARCTNCGLRIDVDIDEPRCACGYLTYQLQGNTCPECGAAIETWQSSAAKQPHM